MGLEDLSELLKQASDVKVWDIEKTLEEALGTVQALREGPESIPKCSPDLHITDRFHQWVDAKLGARIDQVKKEVSASQERLYAGFVTMSRYLWEEPMDPG